MAVASDSGPAGSRRGVPGASFRGHESVRDSREARYDHAKGHSTCSQDSWRMGRIGIEFAVVGASGAVWFCLDH